MNRSRRASIRSCCAATAARWVGVSLACCAPRGREVGTNLQEVGADVVDDVVGGELGPPDDRGVC